MRGIVIGLLISCSTVWPVLAVVFLLSACGGGGQAGDELPASPVVERHRSV